jgi:hypothetical protein
MSHRSFCFASVVLFVVAVQAGVVAAQIPLPEPATSTAQVPSPPPSTSTAQVPPSTPPASTSSSLDSAVAVVELRPVETINQEMMDAAGLKAGAETRIMAAKSLQVRADSEIKVKQAQIETIEAEIKQAKRTSGASNSGISKRARNLAELEKKLLESRKKLRDREIRYWEASRDHFDIRAKYFAAELESRTRRAKRCRRPAGHVGGRLRPSLEAASRAAGSRAQDAGDRSHGGEEACRRLEAGTRDVEGS